MEFFKLENIVVTENKKAACQLQIGDEVEGGVPQTTFI